jgi:hypothetical protein
VTLSPRLPFASPAALAICAAAARLQSHEVNKALAVARIIYQRACLSWEVCWMAGKSRVKRMFRQSSLNSATPITRVESMAIQEYCAYEGGWDSLIFVTLDSEQSFPTWLHRQHIYAFVDEIAYRKWGSLPSGDVMVEKVPRLAICVNLGKDIGPMLFHCDGEWNVVGTSGAETGFSATNLGYFRQFYLACRDRIPHPLGGELPTSSGDRSRSWMLAARCWKGQRTADRSRGGISAPSR